MKALIVGSIYRYGDYEREIFRGETIPLDIPGAYREEYEDFETCYPQVVIHYKNKALLNDKGEPYIHSWTEVVPDPTYEKWCTKGYDHEQKVANTEKYGSATFPNYLFTRKIKKYRWVVDINTLDEFLNLVENYDAEYEYDSSFEYTRGIKHNFIFGVKDND